MMKRISITCDDWKTDAFRHGLLKEGYAFEFDGPSGVKGVHLFRIEVEDSEFEVMKKRLSKTLKTLELKVKRSN